MKMIALTPHGYWQSRRNRCDMFVTFVGVIWICIHFTLKAVSEQGHAVSHLKISFVVTPKMIGCPSNGTVDNLRPALVWYVSSVD